MNEHCKPDSSHLLTKRREVNGPPVGFQCTCYPVPNPDLPKSKYYKSWGRNEKAEVSRTLKMDGQLALRCKKCLEDK